jgi:hypothetical protein
MYHFISFSKVLTVTRWVNHCCYFWFCRQTPAGSHSERARGLSAHLAPGCRPVSLTPSRMFLPSRTAIFWATLFTCESLVILKLHLPRADRSNEVSLVTFTCGTGHIDTLYSGSVSGCSRCIGAFSLK